MFQSSLALCLVFLACGCSPDAQKSDPHREIAQAWDNYRSGDFSGALRNFELARSQSPKGSEDNLQALYGLGSTWDQRRPEENRALAETYYHKIVALGPKSELAPWSLYAIARMKHLPPVGQQPDYPAVRAAYQEVLDRYPGTRAAEEAFIYQQAAVLATLSKDDALKARTALENYLQNHAGTKYRSAIYDLLAGASQTLDQPADMVAFAIKALDNIEIDPLNPKRDKAGAYWRIASEAEFRVGDFETARVYYNKLINDYPIDQRVFPAKLALARMEKMEAKFEVESTRPPATP